MASGSTPLLPAAGEQHAEPSRRAEHHEVVYHDIPSCNRIAIRMVFLITLGSVVYVIQSAIAQHHAINHVGFGTTVAGVLCSGTFLTFLVRQFLIPRLRKDFIFWNLLTSAFEEQLKEYRVNFKTYRFLREHGIRSLHDVCDLKEELIQELISLLKDFPQRDQLSTFFSKVRNVGASSLECETIERQRRRRRELMNRALNVSRAACISLVLGVVITLFGYVAYMTGALHQDHEILMRLSSVVAQIPLGPPALLNGDFEQDSASAVKVPRCFEYVSEMTGWTVHRPQKPLLIRSGCSAWGDTEAAAGFFLVGLQQRGCAISQMADAHFPGASYQLQFYVACRHPDPLLTDPSGVFLKVAADGKELGRFLVSSPAFSMYVALYSASSRFVNISFEHAGPEPGSVGHALFIDDIQVRALRPLVDSKPFAGAS